MDSPGQIVLGPLIVTGVALAPFTLKHSESEQPLASVTVTQKVPAAKFEISCVVAPLLHT